MRSWADIVSPEDHSLEMNIAPQSFLRNDLTPHRKFCIFMTPLSFIAQDQFDFAPDIPAVLGGA